jgi:hypothetical protein
LISVNFVAYFAGEDATGPFARALIQAPVPNS